jgi:hypothetical protein
VKAGRRAINWGAGRLRVEAMPAIPVPEPPDLLGGAWDWDRYDLPDYDGARARRRKDITAALIAGAANWLRSGVKVRLVYDPRDGKGKSMQGRIGTVQRASTIDRYVYVYFPREGRERRDRVRFLVIERIEPVD